MNGTGTISAALVAVAFGGAAQAAVLDFTTATNDGTTITIPEATIVAEPGTTLAIGDFDVDAVCPLGGFGCDGAMTLTFGFDVDLTSLDYGFGDPGDTADLTFFDANGNLVGSTTLNSESGVVTADLSGFDSIRSIFFDNTASTGAGYAYGNISYEIAAAVPLPASLPLVLAGLGGLVLARRRRAA